jgi:hypothetical protein
MTDARVACRITIAVFAAPLSRSFSGGEKS